MIRPLREIEEEMVRHAVAELGADGKAQKARVAAALGISAKTLYNKLHRYGLGEHIKPQARHRRAAP